MDCTKLFHQLGTVHEKDDCKRLFVVEVFNAIYRAPGNEDDVTRPNAFGIFTEPRHAPPGPDVKQFVPLFMKMDDG